MWKVDSLENLREVFIEKDAKKRRPEPGPTKLANIFRNKASEELCRGGDEVISSSRLSRMKIANSITAVHPTQSSFWRSGSSFVCTGAICFKGACKQIIGTVHRR